jgi:WD40 repeat protein
LSDGSLVAWTTRCGYGRVFTVGGSPVSSFFVQGQPSGVAFNPAGTQLAVSSWSGAVAVFNPHTGQREFSLPTASSGVSSVTYSPDRKFLITTLLNESAEIWDAASAQHQLLRVDQDSAPILAAPAFDAGGSYFATGDAAGAVEIWAECPACGDPRLLLRTARSQVLSQLTPLEQAAKQ